MEKTEKQQAELLEFIHSGNHKKIMACIAKHQVFDRDIELELIKRGNHEEIMAYIAIWKKLWSKAESELIKRGNHEEIMAYIKYNDYCFDWRERTELFKRGNHKELMAFAETSFDKLTAEELIIIAQRRNFREITAYIDQFDHCLEAFLKLPAAFKLWYIVLWPFRMLGRLLWLIFYVLFLYDYK